MFVAALAHAYASAGRPERARALTGELTSSRQRYIPSYKAAMNVTALGRKDEAMAWPERALKERSHSVAFLRVEPALDPLRSDRRFVARLARGGQT